MQYIFKPSWRISTVNEWIDKFALSRRNEEGRSALTLARFCGKPDSDLRFSEIISQIIGQNVILEYAYPEYQTRFDAHGKGRIHDLVIKGKTQQGKSVFVGIEAKVNEEFSSTTIKNYYKKQLSERKKGKSTELPERIKELVKNYYPSLSTDSDVKYQLAYALASTAIESADIRVFLVITFATPQYNPQSGIRNHSCFDSFMNKVGAEKNSRDIYKLSLQDKEIFADYRVVKL